MREINLSRLGAALFAAGVLSFLSPQAQAQEYGPPDDVTNWVFQPCFDQGDAGWDNGVVPWSKAVEEATEGTVQVDLRPAGSLTSSGEAFAATVAGTIDVTACWATVYGGDLPEGMLAYGMPMGAQNSRQAWQAMWGDPKYKIGEIIQEAAHDKNLHWVGWTNQGPNAIFTAFPVETLDDLEGKKMRAGGPQALFHETFGGSPVSLSPGEIYQAIKLGTIEGTYWDTGGIDDMSFHEVTDYAVLPGWTPAQHQETYVNLDAWNALNQWQRDQIEDVFMEMYFKTSRLHESAVDEALQTFEDAGGEIVQLPDEEVDRMRRVAIEEVWPKFAARSERTAKGVKIWKQYLKDIGLYD